MTEAQPLLTADEAADILRLTRSRVVKLAKAGELPSVTLPGGEIRFLSSDLWEWVGSLRRHVVQPTG
jgi:excisionase family DNA binding protein